MGKVVYLMNVSLDGFVEDRAGKFGWTRPDEEIHRFHNEVARQMGAFLYGRRMYETMAVWQTMDQDRTLPAFVLEFAQIWKSKPKFVFSATLRSVGENCRLVRGDVADEVGWIQRQVQGDLGVGGPHLASTLAGLRLIDEYQLVVYPTIVGGGKSFFPKTADHIGLRLLETRLFGCGAVYLRYGRA